MIAPNSLIHGDCLEVMKDIPDSSIDLIATDPPYGINYNDGDLANVWESVFHGNKEDEKPRPILTDGKVDALDLFKKFLIEAKRILKPGACVCCTCGGGGGPDPNFAHWAILMDEIIGMKQAVIWDKGGLGMGMHYRRTYEFVFIAQNGKTAHHWNGGHTTSNVWHINKIIPMSHQHPTEKPVALMEKIINTHSLPGDLILEPFCGGGSTAIAAIRTGRKFIAIEKDEQFYLMSKKKIDEELAQSRVIPVIPVKESEPICIDTIPETTQVTL